MLTATAIKLLVKRVLYRTPVMIRKIWSGGVSSEASTIRSSPIDSLPMEVVEFIIFYLRYDTHSLRSCTSTCYAWYIAAVPHLYNTLTIAVNSWYGKPRRPSPIRHMHTLGLLPFVKKFQLHGRYLEELSPKLFNSHILRQFPALTNVNDLELGYLDIPKFMPRIQQHFKHFLPTVESLALRNPLGSRRQIIYFIGLFQHLQDLELVHDVSGSLDPPAGDPTLVPAFVPPLQGWLGVSSIKVGLLKEMVELFGGIRFRLIKFYNVNGMRFLLDACGKTLREVVLVPTDPRGEQLSLKDTQTLADNFVAKTSIEDFDLSRNKSLRVLQIAKCSPGITSSFLKRVLWTITSPAFYKIILLYEDCDFRGIEFGRSNLPRFRELSHAERTEEVSSHCDQLKVFREVHRVRSFELELCACICGSIGEEPLRTLEEAIAEEKAQGGFNEFSSDPYVDYYPRKSCIHYD